MNSYRDFAKALYEYATWHGCSIAIGVGVGEDFSNWETPHFAELTGAELRYRRSLAQTFKEVMDANCPEVIGVETPPWMWERLHKYIYHLPTYDPFEYNYRSYDENKPAMVYSGDRITLKELFAGSAYAEYDMGEKIDSTNVDEPTFSFRATRYLIALLSQIAQITREQDFKSENPGPSTPPETTEVVPEDV